MLSKIFSSNCAGFCINARKRLIPKGSGQNRGRVASDCTEFPLKIKLPQQQTALCRKVPSPKVQFHSDIKIILMRPNQLSVEPANVNLKCSLEELKVYPQNDLKTIIKEVVKGSSEKLDLTGSKYYCFRWTRHERCRRL